jgi:hypothetical protein
MLPLMLLSSQPTPLPPTGSRRSVLALAAMSIAPPLVRHRAQPEQEAQRISNTLS